MNPGIFYCFYLEDFRVCWRCGLEESYYIRANLSEESESLEHILTWYDI